MTELDELERDLLQAADVWFAQALHQKLQRLVSLARAAELFAHTAERPADFGVRSALDNVGDDPFGLRPSTFDHPV